MVKRVVKRAKRRNKKKQKGAKLKPVKALSPVEPGDLDEEFQEMHWSELEKDLVNPSSEEIENPISNSNNGKHSVCPSERSTRSNPI